MVKKSLITKIVFVNVLMANSLVACSVLDTPLSFQESELESIQLSDGFRLELQTIPWAAREFRQYQDQDGNKAFATYRQGGKLLATGFSDEKLTKELAFSEALRLCHAYAKVEIGCNIEHFEASLEEPIDLSLYPPEVIGFPDVTHFDYYQKQRGHKAIAGNASGILGGIASTELMAQKKAINQCRRNTHFSAPDCYIIASE
ncbi:hypothetical protein O1D97_16405 [Marinomonas sp. 15G1-11]|uniref:DUF4189 domain-containing protein n=1 Tax=Marinomonas phaeophyticola TaxID=3004091 RepID=A0ABT4JY53_9GAMM|nr:hypothetical protein [Marinomonas sp. 15G1-11]MCZ2723150.1 hypothetical protein [Marinomonas sp. 15G1-11]